MAAVTLGVSTATTTNNAATYTSGSFTPNIGELLIGLVHVRDAAPSDGSVSLASSSPESLTFTRVATALKASSGDRLFAFVGDQLVGASGVRTVVFGSGDDATAAGNIIQVARVSGMSKVGSLAVRQSGVQDNQAAGGTPTISFAGAVLTTNPVIAFMGNNTNPAGVTEPGTFTELDDTGFNTPGSGSELASVDSGFTASSVTWGGASATAFGALALELDAASDDTPLRWTPQYPEQTRRAGRMIASGPVHPRRPTGLALSVEELVAWVAASWKRAA